MILIEVVTILMIPENSIRRNIQNNFSNLYH